MKIETKFNIGDSAFAFENINDEIIKIVIREINFFIYEDLSGEPRERIVYNSTFHEDRTFATKNAAIDAYNELLKKQYEKSLLPREV